MSREIRQEKIKRHKVTLVQIRVLLLKLHACSFPFELRDTSLQISFKLVDILVYPQVIWSVTERVGTKHLSKQTICEAKRGKIKAIAVTPESGQL